MLKLKYLRENIEEMFLWVILLSLFLWTVPAGI